MKKGFLARIFGEPSILARLGNRFEGQKDFKMRKIPLESGCLTLVYLDSMTDAEQVGRFVLTPLTLSVGAVTAQNVMRLVTQAAGQRCDDFDTALKNLLGGYCLIFLADGSCFAFDTRMTEGRSITEPPTNSVSKGPREGFVESVKTNVALLRRRLKTDDFRCDETTVGRYTATTVEICYVDGIADEKTVQRIKKRIAKIDIDGIIDSSFVARFLDDDKSGFFKLVGSSEKPDVVAAKLLEGRIAVLVDGSPVALTLPYLFIEDLQAAEDYYEAARMSTVNRVLRALSVIMAVFIPALYVSLQTFNYQILPAKFLITIITATQSIPFKPFEEMLLVLVLFDMLREANFRMPRFAGISLSVVGAVVLGDAAVKAGLLGAPAVMIGALSGIGLYSMPENSLLFSLLRLVFLVLGRLSGLYGLTLFGLALAAYIINLDTLGYPYAAPFAPEVLSDEKDAIAKLPLEKMKLRPKSLKNKNEVRQK